MLQIEFTRAIFVDFELLRIVLIGINVLKFDFVEYPENAMNIFQCLEMNDLQRQLFCSLPAAFAR